MSSDQFTLLIYVVYIGDYGLYYPIIQDYNTPPQGSLLTNHYFMVHVISVLLPLLTRNWSWERIAKRDDWHVSQTQEMTEGRAKKKNAATVGWRSKNANARIPVGNCVGGALEHLKWMNYLIFHCIHVMTGGDFKHVLFSPWFWGNWSNLTNCAYFWNGWLNHHPDVILIDFGWPTSMSKTSFGRSWL